MGRARIFGDDSRAAGTQDRRDSFVDGDHAEARAADSIYVEALSVQIAADRAARLAARRGLAGALRQTDRRAIGHAVRRLCAEELDAARRACRRVQEPGRGVRRLAEWTPRRRVAWFRGSGLRLSAHAVRQGLRVCRRTAF